MPANGADGSRGSTGSRARGRACAFRAVEVYGLRELLLVRRLNALRSSGERAAACNHRARCGARSRPTARAALRWRGPALRPRRPDPALPPNRGCPAPARPSLCRRPWRGWSRCAPARGSRPTPHEPARASPRRRCAAPTSSCVAVAALTLVSGSPPSPPPSAPSPPEAVSATLRAAPRASALHRARRSSRPRRGDEKAGRRDARLPRRVSTQRAAPSTLLRAVVGGLLHAGDIALGAFTLSSLHVRIPLSYSGGRPNPLADVLSRRRQAARSLGAIDGAGDARAPGILTDELIDSSAQATLDARALQRGASSNAHGRRVTCLAPPSRLAAPPRTGSSAGAPRNARTRSGRFAERTSRRAYLS